MEPAIECEIMKKAKGFLFVTQQSLRHAVQKEILNQQEFCS